MINASGLLHLSPQGSEVSSLRQAQAIRSRLEVIRTRVLNTNQFKAPGSREIIRSLREDILQLRPHDWENQAELYDRVRVGLQGLQNNEPEVMRALLELEAVNESLSFSGAREMRELGSRLELPEYCQNYPLLERAQLESFYGQSQSGDGLQCFQIEQNLIGLDLSSIGQALISMEDQAYQNQSQELKDDMLLVATASILRESSSFSGLFNLNAADLGSLKACAKTKGHGELLELIQAHEQTFPSKGEQLNREFSEVGLDRQELFISEHIKQALIAKNLYEIKSNGANENARRSYQAMRTARFDCRAEIEAQHGILFVDQASSVSAVASARCPALMASGRYQNFHRCYSDLLRASQDQNLAHTYERCVNSAYQPEQYNIDAILPIMAKRLSEFPLLFDRDDEANLMPFTSSASHFVPSQFAELVGELPGANELSQALKDKLLSDPVDPEMAIEQLLETAPWQERFKTLQEEAKQNEVITDSLKSELTRYQNQMTETATKICENNAQYLHHFPELVHEVFARRLNQPGLTTEQKQTLLAQGQAAQCHLLQKDPPDHEGGLPVALQVAGIGGAIALGLIPGVGAVAAGLILAGAVGVTDGIDRTRVSNQKLEATEAAYISGHADSRQLLDAAGNRTDARLTLASEALLIGGEGLGLLARGIRATRQLHQANSSLPLRQRSTRLSPNPGRPTDSSSYVVTSSVGHIDTSEELLRFKRAFNDDVLNRFGLDGLQNYDNSAELQAFRQIYEQFLEPGRGFILPNGELNQELLKRFQVARCIVANNLTDFQSARRGACADENLARYALNPSELQAFMTSGQRWDQHREAFGAQRIALGDRRTEALESELRELGLERVQNVNCATVSRLSPGFAQSGRSCFAFNTKDQPEALKGAFCSCGSGSASNWMIRCPRNSNEYLRNSNYYDQISLFKNESLNCFRVEIPDNATCFAGPAGPRRGGLGGMSQIFCPNRFTGDYNMRNLPTGTTEPQIRTQVREAWEELPLEPDWKLIEARGDDLQFAGGAPGESFRNQVLGWSPNPQSPQGIELVDSIRPCVSIASSTPCSATELNQARQRFERFLEQQTQAGQVSREVKVEGQWTYQDFEELVPKRNSGITQEELDGIRRYGCQYLVPREHPQCRDPSGQIAPVRLRASRP